jgi:uncharacterized membrane protein HdeD (DUF308 family)
MQRNLVRGWWLLAFCGVLEAIYSFFNLLMADPDGSVTLRKFAIRSTVVFLGKFALGAGVCTIAAGIWSSGNRKSWLLVLNGLALTAYGLISMFWRGRLTFLPVALLFVVMALSIGAFALASLPAVRHQVFEKWAFSFGGAAEIGFAVAFLAFGLRWMRFEQPGSYFVWVSCFFALSAVCMLGIGLRLNNVPTAPPDSVIAG